MFTYAQHVSLLWKICPQSAELAFLFQRQCGRWRQRLAWRKLMQRHCNGLSGRALRCDCTRVGFCPLIIATSPRWLTACAMADARVSWDGNVRLSTSTSLGRHSYWCMVFEGRQLPQHLPPALPQTHVRAAWWQKQPADASVSRQALGVPSDPVAFRSPSVSARQG
jgi:hypothetical protein